MRKNSIQDCPKPACTLKIKVQAFILGVGVLLLVGKFAAYFITNSAGIFTDAMESIVNVVAGMLGLWSVWRSSVPRDYSHPYGHGKVELLTASIEGALIIIAGGAIIYEGFLRIFNEQMPQKLDIGILIIALAGIANAVLGVWSVRVGKRNNSIALIAGGKHLLSDTYSTIGLVVGLVLLYWLKWPWIDGALALIFGTVIIATGIGILRKTAASLIDSMDNESIEKMVRKVRDNRRADWIDVHDLRAISYGDMMHIDCHLTLPHYYSIQTGHDRCDELEDVLRSAVAPHSALISVHSDPCDARMCAHCAMNDCAVRQAKLEKLNELTIVVITENDDDRAARLGG